MDFTGIFSDHVQENKFSTLSFTRSKNLLFLSLSLTKYHIVQYKKLSIKIPTYVTFHPELIKFITILSERMSKRNCNSPPPGEATKRKRDTAFTPTEKQMPLDKVVHHFVEVECKKTNAVSMRAKREGWVTILVEEEFNMRLANHTVLADA